jgi:hypothetical protein
MKECVYCGEEIEAGKFCDWVCRESQEDFEAKQDASDQRFMDEELT